LFWDLLAGGAVEGWEAGEFRRQWCLWRGREQMRRLAPGMRLLCEELISLDKIMKNGADCMPGMIQVEKWKDGQLVSTEVVIDVEEDPDGDDAEWDEDDQVKVACAPAKVTCKAAST